MMKGVATSELVCVRQLIFSASISARCSSVYSAYFDAWGIYLGHPYFRVFSVF
jgi:hypothetical protein